jgi:hypothetical protein
MFFVEYLHDCEIVFFFLFFWISVLLKVVFSKTMVDLKTCDIANSVPNSSLTYKHKKHRRIAVTLRSPLSNLANEQLQRNVRSVYLVVW